MTEREEAEALDFVFNAGERPIPIADLPAEAVASLVGAGLLVEKDDSVQLTPAAKHYAELLAVVKTI